MSSSDKEMSDVTPMNQVNEYHLAMIQMQIDEAEPFMEDSVYSTAIHKH